MKAWSIAASLLVLSVGLEAQGPPAKGSKVQSTIAVTLGSLGCSTAAGADSFEALSWSWGASNPADLSGSGGGSGTGKAVVSELNLTKPFDACSPALFGAVMTGKAFPTLTLAASNKDGTTTTLTLTDVRVSSWQASGSAAADAATESATFGFAKVCLADGASGAKFCYDVKAGKSF
jgi:type VI protein secretion system component Hcp